MRILSVGPSFVIKIYGNFVTIFSKKGAFNRNGSSYLLTGVN